MKTQTAALNGANIKALQRIREIVSRRKSEQTSLDVMVVTEAASGGVGRGRGRSSGSIIGSVNGVRVGPQFVMQCLASGNEADRKTLGFAVAASQREAKIQSAF